MVSHTNIRHCCYCCCVIEVRTVPKEFRRRRSFHRHSIVENPKWMQYSETEQQDLSDLNSSVSFRRNKQRFSPASSEDRPLEVHDPTIKTSLRKGSSQLASNPLVQPPAPSCSSYSSQFDWRGWYNEKVDSDDD